MEDVHRVFAGYEMSYEKLKDFWKDEIIDYFNIERLKEKIEGEHCICKETDRKCL